MFEAVITHQRYCYQFTCIVYHNAVNVYNVKTISYNYKFGITIIKGEEHNCITKLKKILLQYAEKQNGILFVLFKATLFGISKLQIKFNTKNCSPNVYII